MPEPALTIASLISEPSLQSAVGRWLEGQQRFRLVRCDSSSDPVAELERLRDSCDAVLLQQGELPATAIETLRERGLLLPAVVIGRMGGQVDYHADEVHLPPDQLEQLTYSLDAALSRFLSGGPSRSGNGLGEPADDTMPDRWRLANRLQSRLGLLGVFYKRDPTRFLRNLPEAEAEELVASLERTYRDLLLSYFRDPASANQALESFVNTAFFSDLPVTKTVEIHVNLIDAFAKQLSLEGHKSDFLQDYRLALLDVMAHLCEMYRRSIPPDEPLQRGRQSL
ncbi:MAG: circadian clock protein KaiA [Chitinophagaceae bacterium]|nr:circadian clock protein KaiA [Chitinophagaceae bacterium]